MDWRSRRDSNPKARLCRAVSARSAAQSASQRAKNRGFEWIIPRNWRSRRDSNPRYAFGAYNGLANRRLQPLGHSSTSQFPPQTYRADKDLCQIINKPLWADNGCAAEPTLRTDTHLKGHAGLMMSRGP